MESTELRYVDLKNYICRQIYEGVYQDGEKIPSERQMAADYEVSRITVRKALELLEEEELIVREVGNGTTVTLKNHGNETATDMIALVAPSRNPFFAHFIAKFQRCVWEHDALLLYVEAPEHTTLEDCLYRLYSKNIRNAVVWPDDRSVDQEKLLRLRSIGMNLVFFDTDVAGPYADSVFIDNVDAIRTLLERQEREYGEYLYIGWDNLEIGNIRKREESFQKFCPRGQVYHVPWRRDRRMAEFSKKEIHKITQKMRDGMVLCGTGELAQQTAEVIWGPGGSGTPENGTGLRIALAAIDDFEGSGRFPVAVYNQDLGGAARRIYQSLERQRQERQSWKARIIPVKGEYKACMKGESEAWNE